jgi:NADPH:quinone reductase-like Zn-dependent oxidoreductase
MKAIAQEVYGPPGVLRPVDIDKPTPGPGNVLVRVVAAGMDPGVYHLTAGLPYLVRLMGLGFRTPKRRVPGTDFAGTVETVGGNVTGFQPGDEVYGSCDFKDEGSFAEFTLAVPQRLAPKPANLSFEQAAAVPVSACTALQGLRDVGKIQSGQHVLVIGASGGVGTFAVQLAKAFGAEVTGVSSTAKVDLVRSIGADHVIDYKRQDFADGARRYDLILDTAGRRGLRELRRALAAQGTLVIVGGEGGNRITGGFERQMLSAPLLTRLGSQKFLAVTAAVRAEDLETLRRLIEEGKVTPVIDRTFPLAEAPEALRYLHEQRPAGKVVVTVAAEES